MGKQVSARIKTKIKNKFVRAIKRVEAQELIKEQFFRNRKKDSDSQSGERRF